MNRLNFQIPDSCVMMTSALQRTDVLLLRLSFIYAAGSRRSWPTVLGQVRPWGCQHSAHDGFIPFLTSWDPRQTVHNRQQHSGTIPSSFCVSPAAKASNCEEQLRLELKHVSFNDRHDTIHCRMYGPIQETIKFFLIGRHST
jgi:hypothetical protein